MNNEPRAVSKDQLIILEGNARAAHLMNTAIWPVFVTLFLGAVGITAQDDGATKHPALFLFLALAGVFVCWQWWISIGQTGKRYRRLWMSIRHLDPSYDDTKPALGKIARIVSLKTSMWGLRGASLPIVLGVVFAFFMALTVVKSEETEWYVFFGATILFLLLLHFEAKRQKSERVANDEWLRKHEQWIEKLQ